MLMVLEPQSPTTNNLMQKCYSLSSIQQLLYMNTLTPELVNFGTVINGVSYVIQHCAPQPTPSPAPVNQCFFLTDHSVGSERGGKMMIQIFKVWLNL